MKNRTIYLYRPQGRQRVRYAFELDEDFNILSEYPAPLQDDGPMLSSDIKSTLFRLRATDNPQVQTIVDEFQEKYQRLLKDQTSNCASGKRCSVNELMRQYATKVKAVLNAEKTIAN